MIGRRGSDDEPGNNASRVGGKVAADERASFAGKAKAASSSRTPRPRGIHVPLIMEIK